MLVDDLHWVSVRHPGLLIDTDRVMQDRVCAAACDQIVALV
jgi:hypothetical protein